MEKERIEKVKTGEEEYKEITSSRWSSGTDQEAENRPARYVFSPRPVKTTVEVLLSPGPMYSRATENA